MGDEAGRQGEYFIKRVSRFWQYRATSDISTEERRPICYPLCATRERERERGGGRGGRSTLSCAGTVRRSTRGTSHAKIFTVEWRAADSIYRMIKHLTLGYRPGARWSDAGRGRDRRGRKAGDIPRGEKLFLLVLRFLFLSWKPSGVSVQIAFRPAYLTAGPSRAHI